MTDATTPSNPVSPATPTPPVEVSMTDPRRPAHRPRAPTHPSDPDTQKAFDAAAAFLRERDCWTDDKGVKHLNADLVLEGGGVKGIGFAGALLVLAEAGYHFPRVAGTSAGAIAATLVASIEKAGKDMSVISEYLGQLQFDKFIRRVTSATWPTRCIWASSPMPPR